MTTIGEQTTERSFGGVAQTERDEDADFEERRVRAPVERADERGQDVAHREAGVHRAERFEREAGEAAACGDVERGGDGVVDPRGARRRLEGEIVDDGEDARAVIDDGADGTRLVARDVFEDPERRRDRLVRDPGGRGEHEVRVFFDDARDAREHGIVR